MNPRWSSLTNVGGFVRSILLLLPPSSHDPKAIFSYDLIFSFNATIAFDHHFSVQATYPHLSRISATSAEQTPALISPGAN